MGFVDSFKQNFIEQDRWHYLANGLGTTLLITFFSVLIGMVLGFIIAIVRFTHDKTGKMQVGNFICRIYLTFGINSGAYVAEIVRSGIASIDDGQFEAGRSLGLNYRQTMISIILPQAFKNVLPALANECIVLLKETSVSGYIAVQDLTKGGDIIRSQTYSAFMPLISVAIIYLVMVVVLSHFVTKLERRLRQSDRR